MFDKAKILVVDDEKSVLNLLKTVLKGEGYEVITSTSGKEALVAIRKEPDTDIILLDILMPGLDGFEVLRTLKDDPATADICVIMLTAVGEVQDKVKAFSAGASDYLVKPFEAAELLARIETHMRALRAERALQKARDGLETKVKERTAELATANEELMEANEIKNEFISILAHDLGTPMAVIIGNLQLLKNGTFGQLTGIQKKKVNRILRNAMRLDKLRRDTLDLSRMDRGTIGLEKEPILFQEIIREAVEDIRGLAAEKNQLIDVELPDLGIVRCDRDRMRQLLDNYLSNAVRYTGEVGRISVGARVDPGEVRVWVRDNGRGIPPGDLEKVFRRFYRTGPRVEGSTGLGLAIAKGIVEAHGGRAWCESEGEGKGSTFFFTLPLK